VSEVDLTAGADARLAAGAAGAVLWMDRLIGRGPLCLTWYIGQNDRTFTSISLHGQPLIKLMREEGAHHAL
jgi:hypothetical protein